MLEKSQLLVQKLLSYFCIFRCGILTAVLNYLSLFITSDKKDLKISCLIPFQVYILLSFSIALKKLNMLSTEHWKNILWSMADNGFCMIFFLIQVCVAAFQLMFKDENDSVDFVRLILIFHCFIGIIHSFMFVCDKITYTSIKASPECLYNVEAQRANLLQNFNDGYACPNALNQVRSSFVGKQSVYNELEEDNPKEAPNTDKKLKFPEQNGTYEEVRKTNNYDRLPGNENYETVIPK